MLNFPKLPPAVLAGLRYSQRPTQPQFLNCHQANQLLCRLSSSRPSAQLPIQFSVFRFLIIFSVNRVKRFAPFEFHSLIEGEHLTSSTPRVHISEEANHVYITSVTSLRSYLTTLGFSIGNQMVQFVKMLRY